ncbi:MAG: hypothetical protein ACAI38_11950 [Myxococcota bacterium]
MLLRSCLIAALILAAGCARRDFGGLCKLATEILTEPRTTPPMRFARFMEQAPNVAFGRQARRLVEAIANAPPDMRYELTVASAREAGLDAWSCPALASVLNPPAETSN